MKTGSQTEITQFLNNFIPTDLPNDFVFMKSDEAQAYLDASRKTLELRTTFEENCFVLNFSTQISKFFNPLYRGYRRISVPPDGNCAYISFGTTRALALEKLKTHCDKPAVLNLLSPLVMEALLEDPFHRYLKLHNLIENTETFDSVMNQLEALMQNTTIVRAYLDFDIGLGKISGGWAHPGLIQALAEIDKVALWMWQINPKTRQLLPHQGSGFDYHKYLPEGAVGERHLCFENGNHFNRLELIGCFDKESTPIYHHHPLDAFELKRSFLAQQRINRFRAMQQEVFFEQQRLERLQTAQYQVRQSKLDPLQALQDQDDFENTVSPDLPTVLSSDPNVMYTISEAGVVKVEEETIGSELGTEAHIRKKVSTDIEQLTHRDSFDEAANKIDWLRHLVHEECTLKIKPVCEAMQRRYAGEQAAFQFVCGQEKNRISLTDCLDPSALLKAQALPTEAVPMISWGSEKRGVPFRSTDFFSDNVHSDHPAVARHCIIESEDPWHFATHIANQWAQAKQVKDSVQPWKQFDTLFRLSLEKFFEIFIYRSGLDQKIAAMTMFKRTCFSDDYLVNDASYEAVSMLKEKKNLQIFYLIGHIPDNLEEICTVAYQKFIAEMNVEMPYWILVIPPGYSAIERFGKAEHIVYRGLSDNAIRQFVRKYFDSFGQPSQLATDLIQEIASSRIMTIFCRIPQNLALICELSGIRKLRQAFFEAEMQSELYRLCIERCSYFSDQANGDNAAFIQFLTKFALFLFSDSFLGNLIKSFKENCDEKEQLAVDGYLKIATEVGYLRQDQDNYYFMHWSLQSYLAARYWVWLYRSDPEKQETRHVQLIQHPSTEKFWGFVLELLSEDCDYRIRINDEFFKRRCQLESSEPLSRKFLTQSGMFSAGLKKRKQIEGKGEAVHDEVHRKIRFASSSDSE